MKCHVPGPNVKILARAIHALARFGDDLFVESQPECLLLRTLNAAESAYAVVKFNKRFFTHFNHDYYTTEDDEGLKCKISMRSALNVFKSPAQLDKQVETLEVKLDPAACKLVFQLRCRHGLLKTHDVHILDCKAMQAVFTRDQVPNKITAHQRVFIEALSNFQSSDDQVTLEVNAQSLLLRNYLDDKADFTKLIRTQVNIRPVQVDSFHITADTHISFSLKEFRAVLMFAEALSLPIQLNFETEGKPAVFIVHNSSTFEADFVLATAKAEMDTANTTQATTCETRKRSVDAAATASALKRRQLDKDAARSLEEDSHLFNFVDLPEDENGNKSIFNGDKSMNKSGPVSDPDANAVLGAIHDNIPASPAAFNKVRTLFKRCFDATLDFRNTPHVILADNSDSE